MAATTIDRNTQKRAGVRRAVPVAAATKIPAGVIACISTAGLLVNGSTAVGLRAIGVPQMPIDNSAGAAGAIKGEADTGVYGPFGNSAGADQITLADVGTDCYIVDNQTVAKTSGTNTRSVAGKVFDVDASGVWVNFV